MSNRGIEGGFKDTEFKAPADTRDNNLEKKFEVEIKKEDIEDIKNQMEKESKKEGTSGKQSLIFEGAALARLAEEAPEAGIEKFELSEDDIKRCKERLESDIAGAIAIKRKAGEEKGLDEKEIQEMIDSEQVWITEFQKSNLKDALGSEKFKEEGLEVSEEEWRGMAEDLKNLIVKEDWHNVIPCAGHMHNLEPEKFDKEILSSFTEKEKKGILGEIERVRKDNPGEFASRIRYISEFLPELTSKIKLDGKDWEAMDDHFKKAKKNKDYRTVSYHLCNMKVIEGLEKKA